MAPPSLHRVPSGRFPCFLNTMERSDSLPPLSSGFVAFTLRYRLSTPSLLPSPEGCSPGRASGRNYRFSHSGFHSAEMTGPPRFLGDPNACMPCSSTPAEPWHSCCIMPGCCLPQVVQRRLPQRLFRGSITRPTDPLCTLRSTGYPSTTQHSVPAASTLCRAGLITCPGSH